MEIDLNINELFNLIDNNVGRRIFIQFKRMITKELFTITGKIKTAFSNDFSPAFKVETEEKTEEVFANEVEKLELL